MLSLEAILRLFGWIGVFLGVMVLAALLYHSRAQIAAGLGAVGKAFAARQPIVGVRYNAPPGADPQAEREANPAERPNDRSALTNAAEPRSVGSANPAEREDLIVLDVQQLRLLQQIAAHKVQNPGAKKEASAFTLLGARKGSSKAYQGFSQMWDLLYPPPAVGAAPPAEVGPGAKYLHPLTEEQEQFREESGLAEAAQARATR